MTQRLDILSLGWQMCSACFATTSFIICYLSLELKTLLKFTHSWAMGFSDSSNFLKSIKKKASCPQTHSWLHILKINILAGQWWCTSLIPAIGRHEAGGSLWVWDQPGLQSEFQDSKGYTEKPCLKKTQNKRVRIIAWRLAGFRMRQTALFVLISHAVN